MFASKCLSIRRIMGSGLTDHRTVAWGSDPCGIESWPDDFGIDAATIAAFDGDRQLGPSGLVGLGLRVDLEAVGVLGRNARSNRERFDGDL